MPDQIERLRSALADRYAIERELGAGGMATVYLASDLKHDRKVAVKVLRPELAAALGPDRFPREIRILARLQHPHILPLLDSGEADGFLFYTMPYVEGQSLRERGAEVHTISLAGGATQKVFPATSFGPVWSPDSRSIAAATCAAGYCKIEVRALDGRLLHTVSTAPDVYEFSKQWLSNGTQLLVNYQDLRGDGGNRIDLRSLTGGAAKAVSGPAGYSLGLVNLAGDSIAIAIAGPNGTALQRIPIPRPPAR